MAITHPNQVPGNKLYLAAPESVTIGNDGYVSNWPDQSGLGNAASFNVGEGATLQMGVQNGKPALYTGSPAGADHGAIARLPNLLAGKTEGEMFLVVKAANRDATTPEQGGSWDFGALRGTADDTLIQANYPFTEDPQQSHGAVFEAFGIGSLAPGEFSPGDVPGGATRVDQWNIYHVAISPTGFQAGFPANGDWVIAPTTLAALGITSIAFPTEPKLFASVVPGWFFSGWMGSAVAYDRKLTTPMRNAVTAYLESIWNTTGGVYVPPTGAADYVPDASPSATQSMPSFVGGGGPFNPVLADQSNTVVHSTRK